MTLFYTPKIRRFDAGVSPLEVTHFSVPPGRSSFEVVSACPGDCTVLQVASPIYIILGMNHMHRLGTPINKIVCGSISFLRETRKLERRTVKLKKKKE